MHSLRTRLLGVWGLSLGACVAVAFLLGQLYRQSTQAQIGRAEAVAARACDLIGDQYGFYTAGWSGPPPGQTDERLRSDLVTVVGLALAHQPGVEGGIWQSEAGPLAYAFPTYEGTGPKTDLPAAERPRIQAINQQAVRDEQPVEHRAASGSETLILARGLRLSGRVLRQTGPQPGRRGKIMRTRHMMLAATLLAGGSAAVAETAATYDPSQLPAIQGKVAQYSLTPRGDVDGLILADGTEIHLPPHLGPQLVYAVKPGDAVTIHGLKARAIAMVQAMSVRNDATGATVTDTGAGGPPGSHDPRHSLSEAGRIKAQLHGPRGDLNGALLEDGTIVRLPPPEAQRLATTLTVGAPVTVQGSGVEGPLGRVIEARSIGPDAAHLTQVAAPPRPFGHRPPPPGGPDAPPPPPGGPDDAPG